MTSIVFYFQVHQPFRVKAYPHDAIGQRHDYFDDWLNEDVAKRVAQLCYLPMNETLLRAIEETNGAFRCSFSISGTALRQFELWAPEVIDSFRRLAATGAVEFLCETSRHSLAALADPLEFRLQVEEQRALLKRLFGVTPTSFRNTELITDESVAAQVKELGFEVLLAEGADQLLHGRTSNILYGMEGAGGFPLMLRDYPLSDDIAFRFSNPHWEQYPLYAETFVEWLETMPANKQFIGLYMDYETFGEHQPRSTGIFEFMAALPGMVLASNRPLDFATPREVVRREKVLEPLTYPRPISWADEERDLSAWLGNHMQRSAHEAIYALADAARSCGDPELLEAWRDLTTSDHVYYLSTKCASDGDVHQYFSPYDSPHDAFLTVMNVVEDLGRRLGVK
ncbi:Glycosyl hydrolase family 57 [Planctomycetes bacterium Poly30]|uniref:Glycosyl hydrolase family 57 n=1 Tax=Saltatorellus ferox TaxID=2528018 RepID=A0A518ETU1_9BACT|nr:Glycosyl hydrolase family 57 [Planctomycetes bacterium Poly30]